MKLVLCIRNDGTRSHVIDADTPAEVHENPHPTWVRFLAEGKPGDTFTYSRALNVGEGFTGAAAAARAAKANLRVTYIMLGHDWSTP